MEVSPLIPAIRFCKKNRPVTFQRANRSCLLAIVELGNAGTPWYQDLDHSVFDLIFSVGKILVQLTNFDTFFQQL